MAEKHLAASLAAALGLVTGAMEAQTPSPEPVVIIPRSAPAAPSTATRESTGEVSTQSGDVNSLVLAAVQGMPSGGTYRASQMAVTSLRSAIQPGGGSGLQLEPARAMPSFCSGATYLVFLSVLDQLDRRGRLAIDRNALAALLVQEHQADGAGIWGRWNANGPGTARLFYEAGLGRNFTSFAEARPGDFMKVFWNDEIGSRESGHSVVYLGTVQRPEGEFVQYWSSNIPDGFGVRLVPRQRIHRQLFSRLEHPENITRLAALPSKDAYLASMLKRTSPPDEMMRMTGATGSTETYAGAASSAPNSAPASAASAAKPGAPKSKDAAAPDAPTATPKKNFLNRLFHRD